MSDIITKAERASEIAKESSLAACQRVGPALEALSGLELSRLNRSAEEAVESNLAAVNQIIASNDVAVEADYEKFTEPDALDILSHIDSAAQQCIDSETQRVMHQLATAGRKLPVTAIEEVRKHRDLFAPLLIGSVEQATSQIRDDEEIGEDAPFFALFLLTELEVYEAFPVLLEAFRLPDEGAFALFGDAVHEFTPACLALFTRGNTDEIGRLVEDTEVDMYVRWAAASSYKYIVRDGRISRQAAVDALHRHFEVCARNEDFDLLAPLACELGDLAAEGSLEAIRSAYQRGLVDESIVGLAFIESQIASGEQTVEQALKRCKPTGMPDTIAELSRWAGYREEPPRQPRPSNSQSPPIPQPHMPLDEPSQPPQESTFVRTNPKVGRNDPCPCGSGKKFKKCCRLEASIGN